MAMLDISKDTQSMATFRSRSRELVKQLRKSKRPVVLTVRGRSAAVVQDPDAYQQLLDLAARADAEEGFRQGIEDAREGKTRPAAEFFAEFEAEHGIRR
jgi:prevent-host-death family protein